MDGSSSLAGLVESAQAALRDAAVDADLSSLGVLTLSMIALHGRVRREVDALPIDTKRAPWAMLGDRDAYVRAVTYALDVQRARIAALADLNDRGALLESCRLSLQTLVAVVRHVEGEPIAQPAIVRIRVVSAA